MNLRKYWNNLGHILGLSLSLAKAQFKLKNEGSYLGIFWFLLDPLAMFIIIIMIGGIFGIKTIEFYPVYLLLGLIMFNFFRQATISSSFSITSNSSFIKSMKISYEPFVISGVLTAVFSHLFEVIILIIFILYFKISILGLLFYPFILFFFILFILGFSFILATIGTYVFDLANVWNVIANLLWFSTPIFYVVSKDNMPFLNKLNPLYYFISVAREVVVYNRVPSLNLVILLVFLGFIFLFLGLFIFERYKRKFAEVI